MTKYRVITATTIYDAWDLAEADDEGHAARLVSSGKGAYAGHAQKIGREHVIHVEEREPGKPFTFGVFPQAHPATKGLQLRSLERILDDQCERIAWMNMHTRASATAEGLDRWAPNTIRMAKQSLIDSGIAEAIAGD